MNSFTRALLGRSTDWQNNAQRYTLFMAQNPDIAVRSTMTGNFTPQFLRAKTDLWNYMATPVHYLGLDGTTLDNYATGFMYRHKNVPYFVTALHCLTGRNVFTDVCLSPTGYEPFEIIIYPAFRNKVGDVGRDVIRLTVRDEHRTHFLRDPDFNELRTDIGVIRLGPDTEDKRVLCVNDGGTDAMLVASGAECFVTGYPFPSNDPPYFPVWRRGSFALDPTLGVDFKPAYLIDARTSKGMSGSPIFLRRFGLSPEYAHDGDVELVPRQMATSFIGVYGGRITGKVDEPIGYGWFSNRIDRIIEGVSDNNSFDLRKPNKGLIKRDASLIGKTFTLSGYSLTVTHVADAEPEARTEAEPDQP